MNTERLFVRTRATLDQWFVLVVVVLLALALFGGWMTYSAYAAPDEETEQRTVEAWSSTAGFTHSAEVQVENEVFEVGEELPNQPMYFTAVAPELDGSFEYYYDAPDGDVDVDVQLERVVRAVDDDGGQYWSVEEPMNGTSEESVEPGEPVDAAFTVDVAELENESERIEASIGGTPGTVESVVIAHVSMEGDVDGESVQYAESYELLIEPDGETYAVDGPVDERHTEERTEETAAAAATTNLRGPLGGLAVLVASLGALGALAFHRRRGTLAPSAAELERLRAEHERERFDEWITTGRVPAEFHGRSRVEVDTLEGLVDVAIDCDRRVLEDRSGDDVAYYVVNEGLLYVYEPTNGQIEVVDASDVFDDGTDGRESIESATDGGTDTGDGTREDVDSDTSDEDRTDDS